MKWYKNIKQGVSSFGWKSDTTILLIFIFILGDYSYNEYKNNIDTNKFHWFFNINILS